MSPTMTLPTPEAVAALCRDLDASRQTSLLHFAQYLSAQKAAAAFDDVDEGDESEWDQLLGDPAKTANFARWAEESLSKTTPKFIDPNRL
ncbi:MAG: hypothetical protein ABI680_19145 [Chthoniobacteraceae bacterium]